VKAQRAIHHAAIGFKNEWHFFQRNRHGSSHGAKRLDMRVRTKISRTRRAASANVSGITNHFSICCWAYQRMGKIDVGIAHENRRQIDAAGASLLITSPA